MSTDRVAELAIELGETGRGGYASIHRKGCKDLVDGVVLGAFDTRDHAAIAAAIEEETGWEVEPELVGEAPYRIMPCTLRKA